MRMDGKNSWTRCGHPQSSQWRHNKRGGASNYRRFKCLLIHLFRRRSRETSNGPTPLAFVSGIYRWPVDSPHKGLVTRKMYPFGDVIMVHPTDYIYDSVPGAISRASRGGWLTGTAVFISADSWLAPSQWETSLQSNAVSHRLGTNLE